MTNKTKIIDGVQYKQCGTCRQFKPLSDFNKWKRGNFGVKAECKKCSNKRSLEYRKAHPEIQRNKYKNDPVFREKMKRFSREWKKRNPDANREWLKTRPGYLREQQRRFRKAHPDYYKKLYAKRRR